MANLSFVRPPTSLARAPSSLGKRRSAVIWDLSPQEDHAPVLLSVVPSRFKVSALAIQACLRCRRLMLIKVRLLRGTPLSRLRSCVYVVISITRLKTTLPRRRARGRIYFQSVPRPSKPTLHTDSMVRKLRSYGRAIVFSQSLVHRLHERHLQCFPLEIALATISEALNIKLDQAINAGKCKVLLEVFSSIFSMLTIMRFVLDNQTAPMDMRAFKGLSACYYSLKELCRMLSMGNQYIKDSTGSRASRQIFAKLENVHTIKFLLLDLCKRYQLLLMKFDSFANSTGDPITQEFAYEHSPPCLPGSSMGLYLQLQAKKDLSHVLADLEQHPRSFWSDFVYSWRKILNAAEDMALRELLIARLNVPNGEQGGVEYLRKGMFVDKKHIRSVRFLGSGSYGKVEEVLCFGEKYAMKTIKGLQMVDDANEAVVQARLQHPNIVKLMWYTLDFDSQGSLSLLMDLMTTSLETFIEQQAHSTPSRLFNYPLISLNIMMQIAKAMRYLHRQGIMHRDLKAANVLVDGTWSPDVFNEGFVHVKVADFGLAKVKQVGSQSQPNTRKVGTGYWRAPEVFWDRTSSSSDGLSTSNSGTENSVLVNPSSNYSLSADVYSFAMTCYEIVTGRKPFADFLESGMQQRVLKERIAEMGERPSLPPSLHPALGDLIKRCWDGTPKNRPSFEAICEELDKIREDYAFGSDHLCNPQDQKHL